MPSNGSKQKMKATHGRVISSVLGDWSGRDSGPIILELDNKERMELRYDSSTQGPIPKVGDIVRIQYTGESIFYISFIEQIDEPRPQKGFEELPPSQPSLLIATPPAVVVMSSALIISGIMSIIFGFIGDFPSNYAYNNLLAFTFLGFIQICFAACLYMYANE